MTDCVCVTVSPDRPNIFYEVRQRTDIDTDFADTIGSLREKLIDTPRVIVYCQSRKALLKHFDVSFATLRSDGRQCCDVCASRE